MMGVLLLVGLRRSESGRGLSNDIREMNQFVDDR